jgi:hypothetical protein
MSNNTDEFRDSMNFSEMSRAEKFDIIETKTQVKIINAAFSEKAKKKTINSIRKQSFNNKVDIQDLDLRQNTVIRDKNKNNLFSYRRADTNINIKWIKSKQVICIS